jgi:hypothetical protein
MYSLIRPIIAKPVLAKSIPSFKSVNNSFHCSSLLKSKYYPINDDVFQLSEEQKQVKYTEMNIVLFLICKKPFNFIYIHSLDKLFLISLKTSLHQKHKKLTVKMDLKN